jgi:hypothetical protein
MVPEGMQFWRGKKGANFRELEKIYIYAYSKSTDFCENLFYLQDIKVSWPTWQLMGGILNSIKRADYALNP